VVIGRTRLRVTRPGYVYTGGLLLAGLAVISIIQVRVLSEPKRRLPVTLLYSTGPIDYSRGFRRLKSTKNSARFSRNRRRSCVGSLTGEFQYLFYVCTLHCFRLHSFNLYFNQYYRLPAIDGITYLVACHYSLMAFFSVAFCVLLCVANKLSLTLPAWGFV